MIAGALAPISPLLLGGFTGGISVVLTHRAAYGAPGRRRMQAWFAGFFAALAVNFGAIWLLT